VIATTSRNELLTKIENPWQPAHNSGWCFVQVKVGYEIILGKMLHNEATSPEDLEVPYLKSQHVQWDNIVLNNLPTMWASPWEIKVLTVRTGDLLVCEGGDVGRAGIIIGTPPENCIIQNALHLVRAKYGNSTHFLRYLLQHAASHKWFEVLCNRATIAHFTVDKFSQMWVWLPPPDKQRQISEYLDRETTEIDALIAAKKRLLELLVEKRRSLITQAVTRGLKSDVPMQYSGIEWLGEVPRHWDVPPIYTRYKLLLGKMLDEKKITGANLAPYLRNVDVQWHAINTKNLPQMDFDEIDRQTYALEVGDILICEGGESGRTAIWQGELQECFYQKALHRLRPMTDQDDPMFFSFVMEVAVRLGVFAAEGNRSTIQHLTAESFRVFRFPAPPYSEQVQIAEYVRSKLKVLDSLSLTTEKTINLLQERRTSLISAAVTGQLHIPD
jgi:type I restriction enzyme, S subunit